MAKNISTVFKFKGTLGNVTHVDSPTYGPHTRMERGTYTPIELNETMKQCKDTLMNCNKQAKALFESLKEEQRDGSLWWRLVSIFFERAKAGLKPHVSMLAGLECDAKHKLGDILRKTYEATVERASKTMEVTVTLHESPPKKDVKTKKVIKGMTHYRLYIIVLYPNFTKNHVRKEIAAGEMTLFSGKPIPLKLEITAPSSKAPYVLLLGIEGYSLVQQKYYKAHSYKGLMVVKTS